MQVPVQVLYQCFVKKGDVFFFKKKQNKTTTEKQQDSFPKENKHRFLNRGLGLAGLLPHFVPFVRPPAGARMIPRPKGARRRTMYLQLL